MNKKEIILEKEQKIVEILQDYGFSYSDANKMLRKKDVKLNGKAINKDCSGKQGDSLVFYFSDDMKKFEIVFDGKDVVIVNKFSGIETAGENLEKIVENIYFFYIFNIIFLYFLYYFFLFYIFLKNKNIQN